MKNVQMQEPLSVDNCDKEPIHTPGRIQPFGVMLAGPVDLSLISYCSANAKDFLGRRAAELLGSPFTDLLGSDLVHDLRNLLTASTSRTQRERLGWYDVAGRTFEVYAHRNPDDLAVIEMETADRIPEGDDKTAIDRIRRILSAAGQRDRMIDMLNISVAGIQSLTGYDRVMAYRYTHNGDGEIVAEARTARAESFLGQRYPAWDVPAQARALQIKNPLRMLVDVKQAPVEILARDKDLPPLDMGLAHLRGISPIHVEYLGNMGVGATLTIGLIVDGRLWGMIACHHLDPKTVRSDLRIALELYGQMASLLIKQKLDIDAHHARARAGLARERVLAETNAETDLLHSFQKLAPILSEVINSHGLAVLRDNKVLTHGTVPSTAAIRRIARRRELEEDLIDTTESLSQDGWTDREDLIDTGGAMLVRATAAFPLQLIFFREEKTRNVKWAGKPEKEIGHGPFGPRITPRGSFDAYLEEQRGFSDPWTEADHAAARELQIMLTQITAKGERIQMLRHKDLVSHQRQQDLMIAELNHRVKNILALIRSLSRQAKASSASLESYARSLEQRISALAAAHDLAVSNTMKGVSLRSILSTELSPYTQEDSAQVIMAGPTIGLRADVAPMIALVMHEIVSNAAKYGALSVPEGIARSTWKITDDRLQFEWREIGGPTVVQPERHGFGRALIEKAIPYELDGDVDLQFDEKGVHFKFSLPAEVLVAIEKDIETRNTPIVGRIEAPATGKSALLIEDNVVLAMDMVDTLTRLGTERVETVGTVEMAMLELDQHDFDFAVLDMNLRGVVSFDVAQRLKKDGIPFVFVTGYGSSVDIPPSLREVPILTKPVDESTLAKTVEELLD